MCCLHGVAAGRRKSTFFVNVLFKRKTVVVLGACSHSEPSFSPSLNIAHYFSYDYEGKTIYFNSYHRDSFSSAVFFAFWCTFWIFKHKRMDFTCNLRCLRAVLRRFKEHSLHWVGECNCIHEAILQAGFSSSISLCSSCTFLGGGLFYRDIDAVTCPSTLATISLLLLRPFLQYFGFCAHSVKPGRRDFRAGRYGY